MPPSVLATFQECSSECKSFTKERLKQTGAVMRLSTNEIIEKYDNRDDQETIKR